MLKSISIDCTLLTLVQSDKEKFIKFCYVRHQCDNKKSPVNYKFSTLTPAGQGFFTALGSKLDRPSLHKIQLVGVKTGHNVPIWTRRPDLTREYNELLAQIWLSIKYQRDSESRLDPRV